MKLTFFNYSKGSAAIAVNYIVGDFQHDGSPRGTRPIILRGNPSLTVDISESSILEHTHTSGVLSFKEGEEPTIDEMNAVMDDFEKMAFGENLPSDHRNILWVMHKDHKHSELHFVVNRDDLVTGAEINIKPPTKGGTEHWDVWERSINLEKDWSRPDIPKNGYRKPRFEKGVALDSDGNEMYSSDGEVLTREKIKEAIHNTVSMAIRDGEIEKRADIATYLDGLDGFEVKRINERGISIKVDGFGTNIRMEDGLYSNKNWVNENDKKLSIEESTLRAESLRRGAGELYFGERDRTVERKAELISKRTERFDYRVQKSHLEIDEGRDVSIDAAANLRDERGIKADEGAALKNESEQGRFGQHAQGNTSREKGAQQGYGEDSRNPHIYEENGESRERAGAAENRSASASSGLDARGSDVERSGSESIQHTVPEILNDDQFRIQKQNYQESINNLKILESSYARTTREYAVDDGNTQPESIGTPAYVADRKLPQRGSELASGDDESSRGEQENQRSAERNSYRNPEELSKEDKQFYKLYGVNAENPDALNGYRLYESRKTHYRHINNKEENVSVVDKGQSVNCGFKDDESMRKSITLAFEVAEAKGWEVQNLQFQGTEAFKDAARKMQMELMENRRIENERQAAEIQQKLEASAATENNQSAASEITPIPLEPLLERVKANKEAISQAYKGVDTEMESSQSQQSAEINIPDSEPTPAQELKKFSEYEQSRAMQGDGLINKYGIEKVLGDTPNPDLLITKDEFDSLSDCFESTGTNRQKAISIYNILDNLSQNRIEDAERSISIERAQDCIDLNDNKLAEKYGKEAHLVRGEERRWRTDGEDKRQEERAARDTAIAKEEENLAAIIEAERKRELERAKGRQIGDD